MQYRTLFSLVQVKSYAKNHGEPNENDKGYVSISRKKTNCRLKSVQLLVMMEILGLIMTLLMSYELLLMMQAEVGTGIKGLLLSLLPSFPLSAIGLYLKRRSQKKAEQTLNSKTLQLMTEQQQCMHNCEEENIVPV